MKVLVVFSITLLTLTGCQTRPVGIYKFNHYEPSVYRLYKKKNFDLDKELSKLENDCRTCVEKGWKIPPGQMAHIGLLYSKKGDLKNAKKYFGAEKKLYPESAHFMDQLIGKMK